MRARTPFRLAIALLLAALVLPATAQARVESPRAGAPKPATVSIPAPSVGDLTIARVTLQAKRGVRIKPKLSVVNGGALDADLRVFGNVKPVKGKKGRFEAWVLVMLPAEEAAASRGGDTISLGTDVSLGTGVARGKLASGAKGVDTDAVQNPLRSLSIEALCQDRLEPGVDAAAGLLFGTPVPDVPRPSIGTDVCGPSFAFMRALLGPSKVKLELGWGPHGPTTTPARQNVTARPGDGVFTTITGPATGAFVGVPGNSISDAYRLLSIEGEEPFAEASTCGGAQIQLFGGYDVDGRVEGGAGVDVLDGHMDVGPGNDPIAGCPVDSTDPAPSEVKPSWCYWPDGVGILQIYVKGTPGSSLHVEFEGPPGSKGGTLSEAARTTKLPTSGQAVLRTNIFTIGEYEIEVGNVFGKATFEATVDTSGAPPSSPAPALCPDVM